MIYYNAKTRSYYESVPLLLLGPIVETVAEIIRFGFFQQMIHVADDTPIPSNRPFVVAETKPAGWKGETISIDDFETTMKSRRVQNVRKSQGTSNTAPNPYGPVRPSSSGCSGCGGNSRYWS